MGDKVKRVAKLESGSYVFICLDGEDSAPLRREHLFGHLDHIEANHEHYRVAGPLKDGNHFYGSFFIIAANSEQEAQNIMNGDPYISSGMYESVAVYPHIPACGQWLGGITWDQDEIKANISGYS